MCVALALAAATPGGLAAQSQVRGVVAQSLGKNHSCALTAAGGVLCWGFNGSGQVGDGTRTTRWTPTPVSGLDAGVVEVAAGRAHACALLATGGVKCWGNNDGGQLGDGTQLLRTMPTDVVGLQAGIAAISVGEYFSCAMTQAGGVKCWGFNFAGEVGDGTTTMRLTPVDVVGLQAGAGGIVAGSNHACALMVDGGVKCWGLNESGNLGDGSFTNRRTPVDVVGLGGAALRIGAGGAHTCAQLQTGGIQCWGANGNGQLGDGTSTRQPTPVAVALQGTIRQLALGWGHSCALVDDGAVYCWGWNMDGQLADQTFERRLLPVRVAGLPPGATSVAAGFGHACAVDADAGAWCWGQNFNGELGDATSGRRVAPVVARGLETGSASIAAGPGYGCGISTTGRLRCWGANSYGQLGDGTLNARLFPVDVVGRSSGTATVATATDHACAVTTDGRAMCWGYNFEGQLGVGDTITRFTPAQVVGLSGDAASIAVGVRHSCALTTVGGVKCWGRGDDGQVGTPEGASLVPVDVPGLTMGVTAVAAGHWHSCALTVAGGVKCWGQNSRGQLGVGDAFDRPAPADVVGLGGVAVAIAAGARHTCAVLSEGSAKCWGWNESGQLGDGTQQGRLLPVAVAGLASGALRITAGNAHSCAIASGGRTQCWGGNAEGQLGDGSTVQRLVPTDVLMLDDPAVRISASTTQTCAVTLSGATKCWGAAAFGQLGDGSGGRRPFPGPVLSSDALLRDGFEAPVAQNIGPPGAG